MFLNKTKGLKFVINLVLKFKKIINKDETKFNALLFEFKDRNSYTHCLNQSIERL